MKIKEQRFELKDGRVVLLRNPKADDAAGMIEYLKKVSDETEFMVRYPEEVTFTMEEERHLLAQMEVSERDFMINAVFDGKIIGNVGVSMIADKYKLRHRASLGIAVIRKFWQLGLGRELMLSAISYAKEAGFEQIELGVYANNITAISLYIQLGFVQIGRVPRAFRLKNGEFIDEIQMVLML